MKTNLSSSSPSQLETDCLVVVALDSRENDSRENDRGENESSDKARNEKGRASKDRNEKDKPTPSIQSADAAVREAVKDVISSGEVTAKMFETTLLHRPAGLKAKSLLVL